MTQDDSGELLLSFGEENQPDNQEDQDGSQSEVIVPNVTPDGYFACSVAGCHYTTPRRINWYKHLRVHTG